MSTEMGKLVIDEDDEDDDFQEDGGVSVGTHILDIHNGDTSKEESTRADAGDEQAPNHQPTTSEVDQTFHEAFLYAVFKAKKSGTGPHYGLEFPIQPSFLVSKMLQPNLRYQNEAYTIKKTSWKNVKKFIKYLDKQELIKSKDRNGGETVILDIDFDDNQIKTFVPYRLPESKVTGADESEPSSAPSGVETSLKQNIHILTLYRASSKLVPDLVPSKTAYYTAHQISSFLRTYIANNPSLTNASTLTSKRFIKLDPFLANNVLSSSNDADIKPLAVGEIARDLLQKRILEDSHLCIPHWILLRNPPSSLSLSSSEFDATEYLAANPSMKPKPYPAPRIHLVLEKRTGTKTVTRISGLETFHINPQTFGPELARKCAGSASVGQLMGGKPGVMEVVVQGDQREIVTKEVGIRGVKAEWVEITDKTNKGKKKK
jgi:translation initiation factor 2D